ncbi:hypothetical protein [Pseudarthrobacter siccitolerans]|uniref:hypothetical protein n=1 Tax=Pseudarthrobacter siccitolerans TaxID=861266 RepID=UPI000679AFFD|nr:hypothetical protein [Pseudarthrobacter siccitolerans]
MTFFQSFPVPPLPPQPRSTRYVPPPWVAPPAHELPAVVHVGKFLHRSPSIVVGVKSAEVFSTGCSFSLSWLCRRVDQNDEDWTDLQEHFHHSGMGFRQGRSQQTSLMFGVQFPNGSKASTAYQGPHSLRGIGQDPEPPTLALNNGGGSGGDDELSGTGTIWLWPLPPAGEIRLLAQWIALGMPESSVVVDGTQLREAAAATQKYWPEEGTQG